MCVKYGEQLFAVSLDYNNAENMLTQFKDINQKSSELSKKTS